MRRDGTIGGWGVPDRSGRGRFPKFIQGNEFRNYGGISDGIQFSRRLPARIGYFAGFYLRAEVLWPFIGSKRTLRYMINALKTTSIPVTGHSSHSIRLSQSGFGRKNC